MLEWVDPKSTPKRVKPFSVSSKNLYINNNDRTAHFVGHSKLKELDIVDFYKRKQTNENMEAEMKEMDVKQGKNAYSEYDNFDEAIPIQIGKEITTEAYKEKINEDIEIIDKNENIKIVVQRTKWIPIYEVIDEDYIKNSHIFPDDLSQNVNNLQTNHKPYQVL